MLEIIKDVFNDFSDNKIEYVHWKSNEHLDAALNGDTDLDILVLKNQYSEVLKILLMNNFKFGNSVSYLNYSGISDFIGFDEETGKLCHIHLHFELIVGRKFLKEYHIPFESEIFKNKIFNKIFTIDPNQELILLVLRTIAKFNVKNFILRNFFSKDEYKEFHWLINKIENKTLYKFASEWINIKFAECLIDFINHNSYSNFYKLKRSSKLFFSIFRSGTRFSNFFKYSFFKLNAIFQFIKSKKLGFPCIYRRGFLEGGYIISFVGVDGAGKSTLIKEVKKWLSWKIDVYNVYFGSGDGSSSMLRFPLLLISRLRRSRNVKKNNIINMKEKKHNNVMKFFLFIWALLLASEKKKKFSQIIKARQQGMIVLTDRYPQTITMGYNDGPLLYKYFTEKNIFLKKFADWEFSVYELSKVIQPDILFKFKIDMNVSLSRKSDTPKYMIENKIEAINKMDFDAAKIIVLDTSGDLENTILSLKKEIWSNWV